MEATEAVAEEAPSEASSEAGVATGVDSGIASSAPCSLAAQATAAARQYVRFFRWLRDQAVGRHVSVEASRPVCGDRGGFMVVVATVRGAAGELQSLARALSAYYPGSSWQPLSHERLTEDGGQLRLTVEVLLPAGTEPRPRSSWDASAGADGGD